MYWGSLPPPPPLLLVVVCFFHFERLTSFFFLGGLFCYCARRHGRYVDGERACGDLLSYFNSTIFHLCFVVTLDGSLTLGAVQKLLLSGVRSI